MNQESFSTESLKEWKQYASKSKLYVIVTTLEIVDIEFLISRYGKQIMSVVHSTYAWLVLDISNSRIMFLDITVTSFLFAK